MFCTVIVMCRVMVSVTFRNIPFQGEFLSRRLF